MLANSLFEQLEDFYLFTLNFPMFDYIRKDKSRFGAFRFLNTALFMKFNNVIIKRIKMLSMGWNKTQKKICDGDGLVCCN